jgi:gas vesicle protein
MNTRDVLAGAGIGAAVAFMFDPTGGGRRRALVRDKAVRATRKTRDGLDATARDIAHRAQGIAAATRGRFSHEEVADGQLIERVRAKLGRVCSHPRAIDVEARDGEVTLRGPIMADELNDVLAVTAAVRGVGSVVNELEPHESSEGIPSLQGEGRVGGSSLDLLQPNWAPATRAMVAASLLAATGVCIAAYARGNSRAA